MSSPNSEGKRRQIFKELEQARSAFMRVEKLMVQIVNEAPGGVPLPDGQAQIVRAGMDAKQAFERYQKVVEAYRDLSRRGDRPKDPAD